MGVNTSLFEQIEPFLDDYSCPKDDLREFLTSALDFTSRQEKATRIIRQMMIAHGKEDLFRHVVELARIEHGIRDLEPWVRDHVVHGVLSFAVGVCVNERLLRPAGHSVNRFQWKLAGLFHDVGYPAEVAKDILRPFTDRINRIKRELGVATHDVSIRLTPVGLDELRNETNSLPLIQAQIDEWGLAICARSEYDSMKEADNICHGMISALSILYVVDLMYQKYNPSRKCRDIYEPPGINWNQSYFENAIVPACAAIFLHNLPSRCFGSSPIDRRRAPLPFLLKLCDCLQDWDRPSAEHPNGIPDHMYDLDCDHGGLTLTVRRSDRRMKIAGEIESSLVGGDVNITG